mmetsp:Transcript_39228/g.47166  ORF Transcript_39228/g.47166 Transcript_39228/m.47166 type:complete len:82 (-) Transcript_39228:34-279(-)
MNRSQAIVVAVIAELHANLGDEWGINARSSESSIYVLDSFAVYKWARLEVNRTKNKTKKQVVYYDECKIKLCLQHHMHFFK